jgi:hypothetical protein
MQGTVAEYVPFIQGGGLMFQDALNLIVIMGKDRQA